MVHLPECVLAFFRARNRGDVMEMIHCFTPNSTVFDEGEGKEIVGRENILPWLEETIRLYDLRTEVIDASEFEGGILVTAVVTGDFLGSPLTFTYRFQLVDGAIDRLVIN